MKTPIFLSALIVLSFAQMSLGHPSYGLVVTSDDQIYFSDVLHNDGTIWHIGSNGNLEIVFTGQHSHFLFEDQVGSIFGTNHEYLPRTKSNRNTLWRKEGDQMVIVIAPTEDPSQFSGSNFVVDDQGQIYYDYQNQIYVRSPGEDIRLYNEFRFERIMSMLIDDANNVYVADNRIEGGSIIKLTTSGHAIRIAADLLEENPDNPPFPEPRFNMLWAMHLAVNGSMFVANSGSRRITEITPDGTSHHIFHSQPPWYPVAIYYKDSTAYIMECGFNLIRGNIGPRISKLDGDDIVILADADYPGKDESQLNLPPQRNHIGNFLFSIPYFVFALIGMLVIAFLLKYLFRRTKY